MKLLTCVVPCYNEEQSINLFYNEITKVAEMMEGLDFEFLFIDDGSTDNTLNILENLNEKDKRAKYISFSRNFGKEAAIYAGLENSSGDYIVLLDADLQHPPNMILKMYEVISVCDFDCIAARRASRIGEPKIRSFFAKCFYKLVNKISDTEIVDGATDFRLMTRRMVNSILSMGEYNRFSKGIFSWVGYKTKWLEYENVERAAGETKWSFWKLFLYSLEGIMAFSTVPLAISSILGFIMCIISIIMIFIVIIKTLIWGDPVTGYPSLVCIIIFIGGIQLFCTGILGQYLSKVYLEVKKRPIYIVRDKKLD